MSTYTFDVFWTGVDKKEHAKRKVETERLSSFLASLDPAVLQTLHVERRAMEYIPCMGIKCTDRKYEYAQQLCAISQRVGSGGMMKMWGRAHTSCLALTNIENTAKTWIMPIGMESKRTVECDKWHVRETELMIKLQHEVQCNWVSGHYGEKCKVQCKKWRTNKVTKKEPMIYAMVMHDIIKDKLMCYIGQAKSMCRFRPNKAKSDKGSRSHQKDIMRLLYSLANSTSHDRDLNIPLVDMSAALTYLKLNEGLYESDDIEPYLTVYVVVVEVVVPEAGETVGAVLDRREAHYIKMFNTSNPDIGYNVAPASGTCTCRQCSL